MPDAIRQSVELQEVFLPILRADVTLLETHEYVAVKPIACPVTVFGGVDDPAISKAMLAGWQQHTSASFVQHEFQGGHFYVHTQRDAVVAEVVKALSVVAH